MLPAWNGIGLVAGALRKRAVKAPVLF